MIKAKLGIKTKKGKYSILIGTNFLSRLSKIFQKNRLEFNKCFLIIDRKIGNKRIKEICKSIKQTKITYLFKSSEKNKNIHNVIKILNLLQKNNFNRSDCLITVGGGIIGDTGGFAASLFKRGLKFINIPTTLLAQVDSSVGGKTGINSVKGKNLIGSFYQPKSVISELSFLKSLPRRELVCGFAEILKYSLIRDKKFFVWIKKNSEIILKGKNDIILRYAIVKSCKNKVHFVTADEKELGKRMLLNFGHTFAHAIEAASNFSKKINHGEAVLVGMLLATKLSVRKKICTKSTLNEIQKIYKINNLPSALIKYFKKNDFNKIARYMVNDKKNNDKRINLILLKKIGKTTKPGEIKMTLGQMKSVIKKIS